MQKSKNDAKKSGLIQSGKMDITFFSLVIIILTLGLVMLFSASYAYAYTVYGNSYKFISRQAIFAVVGVIVMLIVSKINYHILRKFAWIIYGISVLLLIIVLMLPLQEGFDCKRWIIIGPVNFQPSEIAKFAVILLFAHLISLNYKSMKKFSFGVAFLGFLLLIIAVLVVLEPHLSATVLIFAIGISLMIIGGIKWRYVALGGGIGVGGVVILLVSGVISYGSSRIAYWLDPWADATGKGYQTIQSLLSIGSGGILGQGLGNSMQKHLWVPEPHNDFIFAIVCEELGLIGALLVIILFAFLVWRGFIISMRSPDKFGSLLVIGLVFQVGLQAVLNILVVTNTIPNTGISLPFFSYGGTSLLLLLAQMGVVLSVSRAGTYEKS